MPTTIINASAGSGKTYRLAVAYLQALLTPLPDGTQPLPQQVLATTFTRAAASEILERVLARLAMAVVFEDERRSLLTEIGRPALRQEDLAALLSSICRALPMMQIGTIDALFARVVRVMGLDLAFPPAWTLADETQAKDLALDTADRMLRHADVQHSLGQWRRFAEFKPGLRLRAKLVSLLEERRFLLFDAELPPDDPAVTEPLRLELEEARQMAVALSAIEVPRNQNGMPHKKWETAVRDLSALLQNEMTLISMLRKNTLMQLAHHPESTYHSKPVPATLREILGPVVHRARADLRRLHDARLPALAALVRTYHDLRRIVAYGTAAYRFPEVESAARLLPSTLHADDLYFRLDGRVQHLLLDEFQDTSLSQFQFLWQIIAEVRANDRVFFAVGDVKQSIYGWRGADRNLLTQLPAWLGPDVVPENLDRNWRSSPALLDAVDRVFMQLDHLPCFDPANYKEAPAREQARVRGEAAATFISQYHTPAAAGTNAFRAGRARLLITSAPDAAPAHDEEEDTPDEIDTILDAAEGHHREDANREVAVLLRRRKWIPTLIAGLRRRGIEASGEGGNSVADSAAVELLLSMLTYLDHPGHTLARTHIELSGLAPVFGWTTSPPDPFLPKRIQTGIMRSGLAPVVAEWTRQAPFHERCTVHDQIRCEQLVELARHWDSLGGGRLSNFVARVRAQRLESPIASRVRVMTIHGSKGLEFDAVIIADLQTTRHGDSGPHLVVTATSPDTPPRIELLPRTKDADLLGLRELHDRHQQNEFREDLSVLYVALTRAKSFLDVVVTAPRKTKPSLVDIVCDAWGHREPGTHVIAQCDATAPAEPSQPRATMDPDPAIWQRGEETRLPLFEPTPDRLAALTPSGQEGAGQVQLGQLLRSANIHALERGTAVHALLARVAWNDTLPPMKTWSESVPESDADPAACRTAARELHARLRRARDPLSDVFTLAKWMVRWKEQGVTQLELWRERRFAVVLERELMNGSFDRVVLGSDSAGRKVCGEILDFKTDRIANEAEREERRQFYQPQLDAYARALAKLTGLPPGNIVTRLVWIE